MIGALASDEAGALAFAASTMIGERDLQRCVHSLGAGIHEEDAISSAA